MRALKIANLVFNPLLISEVQCINSIVESNAMPRIGSKIRLNAFFVSSRDTELTAKDAGSGRASCPRVIPVVFAHNDSWTIVVATPDFEADLCWQEREKHETRALLFSYETIAC